MATAFTNGLKELEPEFEELTGISVEFELLDEEGSVRKTQLELASGAGNYGRGWHSERQYSALRRKQLGDAGRKTSGALTCRIQQCLDVDDLIGSTMNAMAWDGVQQCLPLLCGDDHYVLSDRHFRSGRYRKSTDNL